MVDFFGEAKTDVPVRINDLIHLRESGIDHARPAERELDTVYVESLRASDENAWPSILITRTSIGYIVIDGYHRIAAARAKHQKMIRATIRPCADENELIELAFRANLTHGLRAGMECRSSYAWWLHEIYPQMEQIEIARRVGIAQPTVSKLIKRRNEKLQRERLSSLLSPEEDPQLVKIRNDCQRLTQDAFRLFADLGQLSEQEQQTAIEAIQQDDRAMILMAITLLERLLKPQTFVTKP